MLAVILLLELSQYFDNMELDPEELPLGIFISGILH